MNSRQKNVILAIVLLAVVALVLAGMFVLSGCVSYKLGPSDTAGLRDSLELDSRIYRDLDGGRDRSYARGAFCQTLDVLSHSGAAPTYDGGAPIHCEVSK